MFWFLYFSSYHSSIRDCIPAGVQHVADLGLAAVVVGERVEDGREPHVETVRSESIPHKSVSLAINHANECFIENI